MVLCGSHNHPTWLDNKAIVVLVQSHVSKNKMQRKITKENMGVKRILLNERTKHLKIK